MRFNFLAYFWACDLLVALVDMHTLTYVSIKKLQMQLNWSQTLIDLDRYFNNFYTPNAGSS